MRSYRRSDCQYCERYNYACGRHTEIDWDSPQWGMTGQNTHKGTWVPDGHSDNGTAGEDD